MTRSEDSRTLIEAFLAGCPRVALGRVDWDAEYEAQFEARWRGHLPDAR